MRMTPEQVADEIVKIEKELEPKGVYIHTVADPAIFAQTQERVSLNHSKRSAFTLNLLTTHV